MDQLKNPEINLTSDSEDFIDDYWFLSPSASHDGSSVNSIPWADDVVKQNQDLWDRVERMFYREESLPDNDIKLRNEIRDWTEHFPFLRVCGVALHINTTTDSNDAWPSDPNFEEILAIHPNSDLNTRKSAAATCSTAVSSRQSPDDVNRMQHEQLTYDIEKCLRITSGPLLSRRAQNSRTAQNFRNKTNTNSNSSHAGNLIQDKKAKWHPPINQINKPQLKSALVRSNFDIGTQYVRNLYSSIDTERIHAVPYSARIIKVPAFKSQASDFINTFPISLSPSSLAAHAATASKTKPTSTTIIKPNIIRIKTATLVPISQPLRNSITLPAIKIEPKNFDRNLYNDAISALIYPDTNLNTNTNSPNKSLKKRSESE